MQVEQILVLLGELVSGHVNQGAVEVIDAVEEVFGEALERKVSRCGYLALRLVLQVAVIGYCTF